MNLPPYTTLIASGSSQRATAHLSTSAFGYGCWVLKIQSISIEGLQDTPSKKLEAYALFCNFVRTVETKAGPDKWAAEETPLLMVRLENGITHFSDFATPYLITSNSNIIKFHLASIDGSVNPPDTCMIKIHASISRLK